MSAEAYQCTLDAGIPTLWFLPQTEVQTPVGSVCSFQPWTGVSNVTIQGFHLLALSQRNIQALPFPRHFPSVRWSHLLHFCTRYGISSTEKWIPHALRGSHGDTYPRQVYGIHILRAKYRLPYWVVLFTP